MPSWEDLSNDDYLDLLGEVQDDFGAYGQFLIKALEHDENAADPDSDFHHLLIDAELSDWDEEGDFYELMDYLYGTEDEPFQFGGS